jgi:hypothetical protein
MKIIESIRIKYFRSILNTTRGSQKHLKTNELNIIIGSNDAGKSNYLKALNLFFNGSSDPNSAFNFCKDYSKQRHGIRKEENRIEIELIINPPKKQYLKNNGAIKWTKIWKENSIIPDESFSYLDDSTFTANNRSAFYKWLKKIKFKYVPAIKSEQYFSELMYSLYEVLQKDTNELENAFNKQIREKTKLISDELSNRLNLESIIQFKGSFKDLFNRLEFGSIDGKSMLSQRGDGVKIRHIPIILQNIAETELRENRTREPIASTIWGFEEPENNLEYDSAKKLAESFLEYINKIHFQDENYSNYDEGIQIFITTHSPVFYTLSNAKNSKINSFFVKKQGDESSDIKPIANEDNILMETEMKLLPLFELSKHWETINNKIINLQQEKVKLKEQLESFNNDYKCIFLTEDKKKGLVEKFITANNFILNEVDLRTYKGCTNIGSVDVLSKYLNDKYEGNHPHIVVHRDKDYLTLEEIMTEKEKYIKLGISLFITNGTDIESYFTNEEHIIHCHSELDKTELQEIILDSKKENKEKAIDLMKLKEFGQQHKNKSSHLTTYFEEHYQKNEKYFFHGKFVYKSIKRKIQEKYKKNALIDMESEFLKDSLLIEISEKIWKKN